MTVNGMSKMHGNQLSLPIVSSTPVFEGTGGGVEVVGSDLSVPYPSTVNVNDILILVVSSRASNTAIFGTLTGWTLLRANEVGSQCRMAVYYKRALGSESGTLSITTTQGQFGNPKYAEIFRFSGCIEDDIPFENEANFTDTTYESYTTLYFPGAALNNNRLGVTFFVYDDNIVPPTYTIVVTSPWNHIQDYYTGLGGDITVTLSTLELQHGDNYGCEETFFTSSPANKIKSAIGFYLKPIEL